MTHSDQTYSQGPANVPAYMTRWRRCKRWGFVREDAILRENDITGRGFAAVLIAGMVAMFLLIGTLTTTIGIVQCQQFGNQYGRPTHWTVFSGCFVRLPDGRSVTTGQIRAFMPITGRGR